MDFQSVNPLNVRLNMISGNLLPMTADNSSFSIFWRAYSVLIWLFQIVLLGGLIPGCMNVSREKALKDGFFFFVIGAEVLFVVGRFHACRDLVGRLIRRINDILNVGDDTMKNLVTTNLNPAVKPLRLYCIGGVVTLIIWCCLSLVVLFEKDVFYYEDYRTPAAVFDQPLSLGKFLLGTIILSIGTVYLFVKKVGLDVYMVHMVMMITVQYRYIAIRIAMIFRERDEEQGNSWEVESSAWKEKQLKALCRRHNALIYTTSLLKELLSLNFSLIYLYGVMRFCFMAVMFSITTSWERLSVLSYTIGATVQLYILCSCVHQLLDASVQVTDEAFHREWYLFGSSMKSIFMLMITANNLECKVAMFENFNLSLPSLMKILNQSYSIALLFLKMK